MKKDKIFYQVTESEIIFNEEITCSHFDAVTALSDKGIFGYPCQIVNSDPCMVTDCEEKEFYANDILLDATYKERMIIFKSLAKESKEVRIRNSAPVLLFEGGKSLVA